VEVLHDLQEEEEEGELHLEIQQAVEAMECLLVLQ